MIPPFPHVLREERRGAKGWGEKQNVKEKKKKKKETKGGRGSKRGGGGGGNKESGRRRENWKGRGDPEGEEIRRREGEIFLREKGGKEEDFSTKWKVF